MSHVSSIIIDTMIAIILFITIAIGVFRNWLHLLVQSVVKDYKLIRGKVRIYSFLKDNRVFALSALDYFKEVHVLGSSNTSDSKANSKLGQNYRVL